MISVSFFAIETHTHTHTNTTKAMAIRTLMTLVHRQERINIDGREITCLNWCMHAECDNEKNEWVPLQWQRCFVFMSLKKEQNIRRVMYALVYKQTASQQPATMCDKIVCGRRNWILGSWPPSSKGFFVLVFARVFLLLLLLCSSMRWRFCFNDSGCSADSLISILIFTCKRNINYKIYISSNCSVDSKAKWVLSCRRERGFSHLNMQFKSVW